MGKGQGGGAGKGGEVGHMKELLFSPHTSSIHNSTSKLALSLQS